MYEMKRLEFVVNDSCRAECKLTLSKPMDFPIIMHTGGIHTTLAYCLDR